MNDRELDALVMRHVFGWDGKSPISLDRDFHGNPWLQVGGDIPHFTTSADDDYQVLERVRETWEQGMKYDFCDHLNSLLRSQAGWDRYLEVAAMYRVGMYSHAALAALGIKVDHD
jgi:hypothetical protein